VEILLFLVYKLNMSNAIYLAVSIKELWIQGACGNINLNLPNEFLVFYGICNFLTGAINWLVLIAGIGALIVMLWGGYLMITAGGEDQKISQGKNAILWALIGIVFIIAAKALLLLLVQLLSPPSEIQQRIPKI